MDKLVILQDSRAYRREKAIRNYKEKLKDYSFLKIVSTISETIGLINEGKQIKTIITHSSDIKKEPEKEKEIKDYCKAEKVDLVYFTGNQNRRWLRKTAIPCASLSADQIYSENLIVFLDNYKKGYQTGYLIFGANYVLNQLLNFRMHLICNLNKYDNTTKVYREMEKLTDITSMLSIIGFPTDSVNFSNVNSNTLLKLLTNKINDIVIYGNRI